MCVRSTESTAVPTLFLCCNSRSAQMQLQSYLIHGGTKIGFAFSCFSESQLWSANRVRSPSAGRGWLKQQSNHFTGLRTDLKCVLKKKTMLPSRAYAGKCLALMKSCRKIKRVPPVPCLCSNCTSRDIRSTIFTMEEN